MSSPFQKNFSAKSPMSPLNGAYENAADNPVYVSQAPAFADFMDKMTKISTDAFDPKQSKCDLIRDNWHADKMTDKAYADASKDCGKTEDKDKNELTKFDSDSTGESTKTKQEKGIEKFGQDSYISNKMEGIGELATATLENYGN